MSVRLTTTFEIAVAQEKAHTGLERRILRRCAAPFTALADLLVTF